MRYPAFALLLPSLVLGFANPGSAQPANDKIETAQVVPADVSFLRIRDNISKANDDVYSYTYQNNLFEDVRFPSTVWFRFTPPMVGTVSLSVVGGAFSAFSETYRGTGPSDLELIAFDDRLNFSGGINTYSFAVEGGRTYFSNVSDYFKLGGGGVGANYIYLHTFVPGAFSDSFAGRIALFGNKFAVTGTNAGFSLEDGEPEHLSGATLPANKSAWFSITRETRSAISVEVTAGFQPILAVYSGGELTSLQKVAQGVSSSSSPTARLSFVAEANTPYAIVVDGNRGGSGRFTLAVEASATRPGFLVRPASATVYQGDSVFFTAVAASTGEPTYQWQRLAAGTRTWVDIPEDDPNYSGATSDTLFLGAALLEMHRDQFRLIVDDQVGRSTSPSATLTVTEFPIVETEVRGSISLDLSSGTLADVGGEGVLKYYATGLPKGITLNPDTGVISGEVQATPKSYLVTYGVMIDGKRSSVQRVLLINVAPFPAAFSGGFEALLIAGTPALPVGKVNLQVTGAGALSGSYFSLADARKYSFRGSLALDEAQRTASTTVTINRSRTETTLELVLLFNEASGKFSATLREAGAEASIGSSDEGVQLSAFRGNNPAPWAANYTARLVNTVDLATTPAVALPGGNGFATARIASSTGNFSVSGRLSDGTKFTANLRSSAGAEYRFAQKLYSGSGGHLSGWVRLLARDFEGFQYYVPPGTGSDLYLVKPANSKDRFYPAGFGPLAVTWLMDPWVNPGAGQLATSLLLNAEGDFRITVDVGGITNEEGNARGLPREAKLNAQGRVVVATPNPSSFKISVSAGTGAYSGSFVLSDTNPENNRVVKRTVTFFGALIQSPEGYEGAPIGQGFAILPPLNPAADNSITGKVELLAGPPSLPFFIGAEDPE